jgi:hypothetical protein
VRSPRSFGARGKRRANPVAEIDREYMPEFLCVVLSAQGSVVEQKRFSREELIRAPMFGPAIANFDQVLKERPKGFTASISFHPGQRAPLSVEWTAPYPTVASAQMVIAGKVASRCFFFSGSDTQFDQANLGVLRETMLQTTDNAADMDSIRHAVSGMSQEFMARPMVVAVAYGGLTTNEAIADGVSVRALAAAFFRA